MSQPNQTELEAMARFAASDDGQLVMGWLRRSLQEEVDGVLNSLGDATLVGRVGRGQAFRAILRSFEMAAEDARGYHKL